MIVAPPQLPASCDSCGHIIPFEEIPVEMYALLLNADLHETFAQELRLLRKVEEFYERNPSFEQLFDCRDPLAETDVVQECRTRIQHPDPDDAEVLAYLSHNYFVLKGRLEFVFARFEQTKASIGNVRCPRCEHGRLWRTPRNQHE